MALPDFIIIGAMKCGTTTLQAQLVAQPGVFMTTPKEPNFFSNDEIYAKGLDWYEGLYSEASPGDLLGEASTHYTKLPTYPETLPRLTACVDQLKVIYLIRNPIIRAVSHYIHEWTMGEMSGEIDQAFRDHPELIAYSRYGMQIAPWFEAFGADNILIASLEEMNRTPQAVLDRVGQFLGLDQTLVWHDDAAAMNVSAERIRRFPLHELIIDNPVATRLRRLLVPQALRDRIKQSRQMQKRPELSPALKATLEEVFTEDYARLTAQFPGVDLSASYPFCPS